MKLTHPARRDENAERDAPPRDQMETPMNTLAGHPRTRTTTIDSSTDKARARSLRSSARRFAGWWSADPMSASFSAAREHDQRLLQRVGR